MPLLRTLPPGTKFRIPDLGLTGRLQMVNDCRARVKIDQPQQDVEFTSPDGQTRTFRAQRHHETSWTPAVCVEVLSYQPLTEKELEMPTKTKKQKTATKPSSTKAKLKTGGADNAAATPKAPRKSPDKKPGQLSQLEAAVKVLTEAQEPLTTKGMVELMAAKGYWTSPGGKTPAATLYAAILREINTKRKDSRFQKADRGLFNLNR